MAANFGMSIDRGSDFIPDHTCNMCTDGISFKEAAFYCELCSKCYCEKCIKSHNVRNIKHPLLGRAEKEKWPVARTKEEILQLCSHHPDEKIMSFCTDHSQLCCSECVSTRHGECSSVVDITVHGTNISVDLVDPDRQLQMQQQNLQEQIQHKQDNIRLLQMAFDESKNMINTFCSVLIHRIRKVEENTLDTLRSVLDQLKTDLNSDIDRFRKAEAELQQFKETLQVIGSKPEIPSLSFIAHQKCNLKLSKCEEMVKQFAAAKDKTIRFEGDTEIINYVNGLDNLGIFKQVSGENRPIKDKLQQKKQAHVKLANDQFKWDLLY